MKRRTEDPELVAQLRAALQTMGFNEACRHVGCAFKTGRYICEKHGLERHTKPGPRPTKLDAIEAKHGPFEQIVEDARRRRVGPKDLGAELGISTAYIRYLCEARGIDPLPRGFSGRLVEQMNEARARSTARVSVSWELDGVVRTTREWADAWGVARSRARYLLKREGATPVASPASLRASQTPAVSATPCNKPETEK